MGGKVLCLFKGFLFVVSLKQIIDSKIQERCQGILITAQIVGKKRLLSTCVIRPQDKSVYLKIFFLFLKQNIFYGYSIRRFF